MKGSQTFVRVGHYARQNGFSFLSYPDAPRWRPSQIGALGAVVAHWSLAPHEAALISMPTGSGKTAIALALPYLAQSRRVLVVVPNAELRTQTALAFRTNKGLREIGALETPENPNVHALIGNPSDWTALQDFDVIVAIPGSLASTQAGASNPPPKDFFDLIIIDEAHHAPAWTWRAVPDFFENARVALLTATPSRRDRQPIPGRLIFHYPLRNAIEDGTYKQVEPVGVTADPAAGLSADTAIALKATSLLRSKEHLTSRMLIRVSSVERASAVQELYLKLGVEAAVIHSRMSRLEQDQASTRWRTGKNRALVAVNMMGEGVDVPNLRLLAYHDRHITTQATVQLIGRLARVSEAAPQPSAVIFEQDQAVLSELRSAVDSLYQEDASWQNLLPKLADDAAASLVQERDYLKGFSSPPASISLEAIKPRVRVVVLEAPPGTHYEPSFRSGTIPKGLTRGEAVGGSTIIYSSVSADLSTLVLVGSRQKTPQWYQHDSSLASFQFSLHVLTWKPSPDPNLPSLLFINSDDQRVANELRSVLDPESVLLNANPAALQASFDVLKRYSVSSVGVRSTFFGSAGAPSYAMFGGTHVERGMREADTNSRALGHAMAQVQMGPDRVTVGFASAKGKYWESRHLTLREYHAFTDDLAGRYRTPASDRLRALLPEVARGERTSSFDHGKILLMELDWRLMGTGWVTANGRGFESLYVEEDDAMPRSATDLPLRVCERGSRAVVWRGVQRLDGSILEQPGTAVVVRASGQSATFAELFMENPPSIYFLDGSVVHGSVTYSAPTASDSLPPIDIDTQWDWSSTNVKAETKRKATNSIHHLVEAKLLSTLKAGSSRWVLCDDGAGEVADHIVIEQRPDFRPVVELWHSKASSSTASDAGVRVNDLQVLTQQAIKSRRHFVDPLFWRRLGERLAAGDSQLDLLGGGSKAALIDLCIGSANGGRQNFADAPPLIKGKLFLVQPGFSLKVLTDKLKDPEERSGVGQVREFLTILHNSTQGLADVKIICRE